MRFTALLISAAIGLSLGGGGGALADTTDKKIALSNNYAGNSWRQAMLRSWDKVTKQAVADGVVAAADPFTTAENQVTEQAAQIQNLVLQGYNAIVVNAASPDALNGAIKEACDAGIIVVSFDGIVTEPCAWRDRRRLQADGQGRGRLPHQERCPTAATCSRSAASPACSSTTRSRKGIHEGVAENPQFKIVGSVHGDWDQAKAQAAVAGILPSLPEIKAVVTQGGDGYGAAQAFAAAGRPTPDDHHGQPPGRAAWWKEQKDANGYETMSVSIAPGVSTLAFWVAQQILDGKEVPKDLVVPFLRIDQDNLEQNLATTEKGGVANVEYTLEDAQKVIAAGEVIGAGSRDAPSWPGVPAIALMAEVAFAPPAPASCDPPDRSMNSRRPSSNCRRREAVRRRPRSRACDRLSGRRMPRTRRPQRRRQVDAHARAGRHLAAGQRGGPLRRRRRDVRLRRRDGAGRRRALRFPGIVALPQPHRGRECLRASSGRLLASAGASAAGRLIMEQARRDLPRPRHPSGRPGRRPAHRQPPDGGDRARLHRDRRAGPAGHPGRANLLARRARRRAAPRLRPRFAEQGGTTVLISHLLSEVLAAADRSS